MPSECCIEYINLYNFTEDFRVVFRFSHTSTFELIPVLPWLPGALVTIGGEYDFSDTSRVSHKERYV